MRAILSYFDAESSLRTRVTKWAAAAALALMTDASEAALITFDDLPVDTVVTDQYCDLGVEADGGVIATNLGTGSDAVVLPPNVLNDTFGPRYCCVSSATWYRSASA